MGLAWLTVGIFLVGLVPILGLHQGRVMHNQEYVVPRVLPLWETPLVR